MTIIETLRARFRPEWKRRPDLAGLEKLLETALTLIPAPRLKKAAIEQAGTLNEKGVAEALRAELGRVMVPALRDIRRTLIDRKEALDQDRANLTKPTIDGSDLAAALRRQEVRAYLRGLPIGERLGMLLNNPDAEVLAAALEGPAALSGLTSETRGRVEEAYVTTNHGRARNAMEDREEALTVVDVATQFAIGEMRSTVGLEQHEFDSWFSATDGAKDRQAA